MTAIVRDVKFALRMFAKLPTFTATAVLTLTLGVGGVTAIFSVVNAVLLRPLPYAEPDRVVQIWENSVRQPLFHQPPDSYLKDRFTLTR